ncbi:MAG: cytochrome c nitrite reductase small subunit [Verrucomicrobiae bacterium]|nr:cytochrome c nitrite reductase small subunit [Verrucomicrobiae bacterium]
MKLAISIALGILMGLGGYTFYYAQGASYLSNDPAACVNCHIMREQYDGWLKSPHRPHATCNDCHTPHALIPKYFTKAENGFWHSKGFTLQDFHEPIRIRPRNSRVLNENCVACHREFTAEVRMTHGQHTDRLDCIRCHVDVGHGPPR